MQEAGGGKRATVALDARMVHHSGIGTYIREIVAAMVRLPHSERDVALHFLGETQVLERYGFFCRGGTLEHLSFPIYSLREQFGFREDPRIDAYHFPHYNVPWRLRAPFCVTIHDLIHLLFPQSVTGGKCKWLAGRAVLRRAARRARVILTVSDWSKNDIVEHLGVAEEKVVVTPNGVGLGWRKVGEEQVEALRRELGLPAHFLLAVGVNKPHKNFPFLIETFLRWSRRCGEDVHLVLCGMQRNDQAMLSRFVAEQDGCGRVHFVPYLEHARLPALYQAARALVFPSLYEGFGLPPLEAQRLGVPVIASSASCIPEVSGEGALYFDPRSCGELQRRLNEFFGGGEALAQELVALGHENERRYSWEHSARRTLEVYRQMLGQ